MAAEPDAPHASLRARVLFVDDDPLVLRTLRRTATSRDAAWDAEFVSTAEHALTVLETHPVDVVVSDMRMPGLNGAQLLRRVQLEHPSVARVVLSAASDESAVFRSVPVAHLHLTKPFDPPLLLEALERAMDLGRFLSNPLLLGLLGAGGGLPPAPRIYTEVTEVMAREEASLRDVVTVIEGDRALAAHIVRLAAAGRFHLPNTTGSLFDVAGHLGTGTLRTLVLALETLTLFEPRTPRHVFSKEAHETHGLDVYAALRDLLPERQVADEALLAGMLHDVGRVVLASRMPDACSEAEAVAARQGLPRDEAERLVMGASHAEVGACLLGLWGLPATLIHAVAQHHSPANGPDVPLDLAFALALANRLANDRDGSTGR